MIVKNLITGQTTSNNDKTVYGVYHAKNENINLVGENRISPWNIEYKPRGLSEQEEEEVKKVLISLALQIEKNRGHI